MSEPKREVALAIKYCLDNLATDAKRNALPELAHMLAVAALAAEEAARTADPVQSMVESLMTIEPAGRA